MLDDAFPIRYDMPLFRPPSEGRSLILQVTLGCSWNRCSFCDMYTTKKFRMRPTEEVLAEIEAVQREYTGVEKVFLADGNSMVASNGKLMPVLTALKEAFPTIKQISSYANPKDILRKSEAELAELRQAGLNLVYVGVESGDDALLQKVRKDQTQIESIESLQKAGAAGIGRSVMVLNGLGGRRHWEAHAANTAEVANRTQPEFLASLVVTFPLGEKRYREAFGDDYEPMELPELFEETRAMLGACELKGTEFRSNHASNYLALKGLLNRDKEKLLGQLTMALEHPERMRIRNEWERGL